MAVRAYPSAVCPLPSTVRARLTGAVQITVGDLDATATLEARRRTPAGWTAWRPLRHGAVWAGAGAVVEIRAANHTALEILDGLRPGDLRRKAQVAEALEWAGLPSEGTRAELEERLAAAP